MVPASYLAASVEEAKSAAAAMREDFMVVDRVCPSVE